MSASSAPSSSEPRPYLVATVAASMRLDTAPHGRAIASAHRFDPLRRSSAPFLHRIEELDAQEYGPLGMAKPRWALYDCAELPGVIVGYGHEAPDGFRPCSMVVAVPRMGEGRFLLYALASPFLRLRFSTLALALAVTRATDVIASTPWASPELAIYARFAPLTLRAAHLPAHDVPASCVLELPTDATRIAGAERGAAREPEDATLHDLGDDAALRSLQRAIEAGRSVRLVGPPRADGRAPFTIGQRA